MAGTMAAKPLFISALSALRASGRLMVSRATPLCTSQVKAAMS